MHLIEKISCVQLKLYHFFLDFAITQQDVFY
jgi:hypothetical protein